MNQEAFAPIGQWWTDYDFLGIYLSGIYISLHKYTKASNSWVIPWYTIRKRCITSIIPTYNLSNPIWYLTLFGTLRHATLVTRASEIGMHLTFCVTYKNNDDEEQREHFSLSHFFRSMATQVDRLFRTNGELCR